MLAWADAILVSLSKAHICFVPPRSTNGVLVRAGDESAIN